MRYAVQRSEDATLFNLDQCSTLVLTSIVGAGLSNPSKMPGFAYGLPAWRCKVGGRLQEVKGSTCSGCYAMKGSYVWPAVAAAYERRFESLSNPLWAPAMALLIARKTKPDSDGRKVFRWHDSGDLQSLEHLRNIVEVCDLTPDVDHWLPTREYAIVTEYVETYGGFPPNLNVRLSAHMVGGKIPTFPRLQGHVTISTVSSDPETYPDAHDCPSRFQNNECGSCRACWDTTVQHVDYHLH